MTGNKGVLVVADIADGEPASLTYELLGMARRLAEELGGEVSATLFGGGTEGNARDLIAHGAERVFVADDAIFADRQADAWTPELARLAGDIAPAAILFGHTEVGADLAPRLAFRLETAMVTNCITAEVDGGKLLFTRPCYGGSARETVSPRTAPSIATVKAQTQEPLARDDGRSGDVVAVDATVSSGDIRTRVLDRQVAEAEGVRLEDARVVIAGGGGMKGRDAFILAEDLADELEAAVGASRVPCDFGWCPASYLIGLSGRTVAPELYIALGISGAGHHLVGCMGAKNIVAVNNDPNAAIFYASRFGVVADCNEFLPAFTEEVRKIKG